MSAKKKILVVDDSEMNRSLLSDMLSNEFEIIEAENGMEASVLLNNHSSEYCLMLLDIVMPVMDGFELLALMNKNNWIKDVPVVMISAETVPSYVERAYDLGVLDYISRPFDERIVQRRVTSTIMLTARQKELSQMVADQIYEKEKDNRLMIEILSNLVEFRNGESGLHVLHIYTLTELLLRKLVSKTDRYPSLKKDIHLICNASSLHDIGKIAVPSEILNKPGRLTKEEFEIMKTHSAEGAKILEGIPLRANEPLVQYGYQICRWHHERYDGKGYPDGLKGEEIPIAAQVVSLADVYDALTSKRVYKDAIPHETAVEMILNGECGTFNPLLLECLTDIKDQLKRELRVSSSGRTSELEVMSSAERMLEKGDADVSERTFRLLEHERMKYQFFAELAQVVQFEYTAIPEIVVLSEWGARYLNLPETIVNPRESAFGAGVFQQEDFEYLLERLKSTTPKSPVIEGKYLLNINGEQRWNRVICRAMWVEKEDPEYEGAIGKIVDIHEDMEKVKDLEMRAEHDSLTGLLNHKAAKAKISSVLEESPEKQFVLIMFDLDKFKDANDVYGHLFGDEVLKCVADIIRSSIRSADIAARMGGDEYIIFMEHKNTAQLQVSRIFEKLHRIYQGFEIRASMGAACTTPEKRDYDSLFRMADEAMYDVKRNGRGAFRFYEEGKGSTADNGQGDRSQKGEKQ